ncbi:MAG: hypothetical protein ACP6IQ_02450 [Candidatus Njordarchaeia archaeon]
MPRRKKKNNTLGMVSIEDKANELLDEFGITSDNTTETSIEEFKTEPGTDFGINTDITESEITSNEKMENEDEEIKFGKEVPENAREDMESSITTQEETKEKIENSSIEEVDNKGSEIQSSEKVENDATKIITLKCVPCLYTWQGILGEKCPKCGGRSIDRNAPIQERF